MKNKEERSKKNQYKTIATRSALLTLLILFNGVHETTPASRFVMAIARCF